MSTSPARSTGVASPGLAATMVPGMFTAPTFAASPVAQVVLDSRFRVQRANQAWVARTGSNPCGRLWLDLMHPDERSAQAALLASLQADRPGRRLATRLGSATGDWFDATIEATPINDAILITMLPPVPVNAELVEDHRIVTTALAHDLHQHARLIGSYLSLLGQAGLADIDRERLDFAHREADRLLAELTGLVRWLRLRDLPLARAPCDLKEVAPHLAESVPGLAVEFGPLPVVHGDRALIEEMLKAVLTNAALYAEPPVRIEARRNGADWEILVADHGPGIPEEERSRILQPLRRLHTWEQVPGHGMGLAIAERIASRHGGSLSIGTSPSGGCVVRVRLPS